MDDITIEFFDIWVALDPNLDINIFLTDDESIYFNLYGVSDGVIDTNIILHEGYIYKNPEIKKGNI